MDLDGWNYEQSGQNPAPDPELCQEFGHCFDDVVHCYNCGVQDEWDCYLCEPDVWMGKAGPSRKVVKTYVTKGSDPTQAYVLECGHTIL